jgi:hypothetical protein
MMKRFFPANFILLFGCLALIAVTAAPVCVRAHRRTLEEQAFKALHRLDNASDLYLHQATERAA